MGRSNGARSIPSSANPARLLQFSSPTSVFQTTTIPSAPLSSVLCKFEFKIAIGRAPAFHNAVGSHRWSLASLRLAHLVVGGRCRASCPVPLLSLSLSLTRWSVVAVVPATRCPSFSLSLSLAPSLALPYSRSTPRRSVGLSSVGRSCFQPLAVSCPRLSLVVFEVWYLLGVTIHKKMSLISQNVIPNGQIEEIKRKTSEKPSLSEGDKIKKRKKEQKEEDREMVIHQEKEMKKLENILFGSLYSPVEFGKDDGEELMDVPDKNSALFFTDRSADTVVSVYEENVKLQESSNDEGKGGERKPVWVDEEEEKISINIAKVNRLRKLRKEEDESVISGSTYLSRLRAQHIKLNPGTEWAQLDLQTGNYSSDDEDSGKEEGISLARGYKNMEDVDEILQTNEDLVVKSSERLLPGLLEYSRLIDANAEDPSSGPINSVQFHRNAQLLLTGGLDKKLRFFQIDGKRNTKIQSIFLDDCPVRKAAFLPDGSQVMASGRRKFFYSFDLVKATVDKIGPLIGREEKSLEVFEVSPDSRTVAFVGNEGYILLVSPKTKELIGTLKMNGTCRSLAFANDGQHLLSSGGDGHVYHWDLRTRACFHKAVDEGCINGTALCTSPSGSLFAAGSDSGIVNIYNREEFLGGKRKPMKTIENLTTKVDFMKFNTDSQILAISSSMKKNSLKLIHIPSFTVFSNWPPPNRTLHYPRCLDFSPGGGFMALGNAAGKVLLYKLHHYNQA